MVRPMPVLSLFPNFPEPPIQLNGVGQRAAFPAMDLLHLLLDHLDCSNGATPNLQFLLPSSLQNRFAVHLQR